MRLADTARDCVRPKLVIPSAVTASRKRTFHDLVEAFAKAAFWNLQPLLAIWRKQIGLTEHAEGELRS